MDVHSSVLDGARWEVSLSGAGLGPHFGDDQELRPAHPRVHF